MNCLLTCTADKPPSASSGTHAKSITAINPDGKAGLSAFKQLASRFAPRHGKDGAAKPAAVHRADGLVYYKGNVKVVSECAPGYEIDLHHALIGHLALLTKMPIKEMTTQFNQATRRRGTRDNLACTTWALWARPMTGCTSHAWHVWHVVTSVMIR